jgi:hypothetical protein
MVSWVRKRRKTEEVRGGPLRVFLCFDCDLVGDASPVSGRVSHIFKILFWLYYLRVNLLK